MTTPRGIFITGTDTGIGKTYLGVRLIQALTVRGIAVTPRKPIESGCQWQDGDWQPADALALAAACANPPPRDTVCRYRLGHALSPERAASLEGVDVTIEDLAAAYGGEGMRHAFWMIEGAGGFYSPLAADGLNADLARRLDLPVVLVAADRLGCINHVLLTAEAVAARGLILEAVVLNRLVETTLGETDTSDMDNACDLRRRLACPVFQVGYGGLNDDPGVTALALWLMHDLPAAIAPASRD